eukprot:40941-Prymnesium_polylepis.1
MVHVTLRKTFDIMPDPHASLSDPSTHAVTNMQTLRSGGRVRHPESTTHVIRVSGRAIVRSGGATERPAQHDSCAL